VWTFLSESQTGSKPFEAQSMWGQHSSKIRYFKVFEKKQKQSLIVMFGHI
jgi:hypothetical protein